jgi:hypothetical protein
MPDKAQITDVKPADEGAPAPATPPVPPKRSPGHRGQDMRDTVAEMAARAHEISLEAGSKMAAAMKEVVGAAAGITGFAIESARDLVQYMVRRGQMTQEEADKLIREAEDANSKRKPFVKPPAPEPKPVLRAPDPVPMRAPEPIHEQKIEPKKAVAPVKAAPPPPAKKAAPKKPSAPAKAAVKKPSKPAPKAAAKQKKK